MANAVNAEYVNPFLIAATKVIKDMMFVDAKVGKPFVRATVFDKDTFLIILGVTGRMRGQVFISFSHDTALDVASKMCMMTLTELDELAKSAICELGNMILGNTATVFSTKGISIDITPPTTCIGPVTFSNIAASNICIPLAYAEDKAIEINIAIRDCA